MVSTRTDGDSTPPRTVTPSYHGRPDREMDVIGWAVLLILLVLVLPLLPVVLVFWLGYTLYDRLTEARR